MRIEILFEDRVGIAQEILFQLAQRRLNVSAVEVDPPAIYIDAPALDTASWQDLQATLTALPDVHQARVVDMLPGARRRLHLDTLLAALPDPVLLVDGDGLVLATNPAAASLLAEHGTTPTLGNWLGDESRRLREITLAGRSFQVDIVPVRGDGAILTLLAPVRLGGRMDELRNVPVSGFDGILGRSAPIRDLKERGLRVAAVDAPLLILGETGTGKELIAQASHRTSPRKEAPFLALNCAAVPENLAESELFGYAPGAFSGAQRGGKPGLIELAEGGTVFLDEIGELSPYLQSKLLRFLADRSFRRVGGNRELKANVRIISATHRDLASMVAEGSFRQDLYYRLNVLQLQVPPLRDRGDDILLLARHFVTAAAAQCRRPRPRLSHAVEAALLAHPWPGNVRQLENTLFRAVAMTDKPLLELPDIDLDIRPGAPILPKTPDYESWDAAIESFERDLLTQLLPDYPSTRRLAARLKTTHTLIGGRLRKYGLSNHS